MKIKEQQKIVLYISQNMGWNRQQTHVENSFVGINMQSVSQRALENKKKKAIYKTVNGMVICLRESMQKCTWCNITTAAAAPIAATHYTFRYQL